MRNKAYKTILRVLLFFIIVSCILGCTETPEYKADSIIGYWQVLRKSNVTVNGIPGTPYEKGYYVRFLDNNCGYLYDRDENRTNDIKWAFQERETQQDILLISTALNSSGQSSDFSLNEVNFIEKFEEMNFSTFSTEQDTIDGDIYDRGHLTTYVRQ